MSIQVGDVKPGDVITWSLHGAKDGPVDLVLENEPSGKPQVLSRLKLVDLATGDLWTFDVRTVNLAGEVIAREGE